MPSTFVSRAEWGAAWGKPLSDLSVSQVTIHWAGTPSGNPSHAHCAAVVRSFQAYHIHTQGWADIAYNLIVCAHGYIFEGRGLGKRSAANGDTGPNSASYAICYLLGTGEPFTDAAKDAINDAAELLVPGARTWQKHRFWTGSECPGDVIIRWVDAGHPRASAPPAPPAPKETDTVFSPSPVPAFHFIALHSQLLMTAEPKKHGRVTQEEADGSLGQRWMAYGHDDGTFSLVVRDERWPEGLALDVPDNDAKAGALLQVFPFDGNPAQRFVVEALEPGIGVIKPATNHSLAIDLFYASPLPGAVFGLYTAHGQPNQRLLGAPTA